MTCAKETVFEYIQDDTRPSIRGTYADENGNPIDISAYTVSLLIATTPATIVPGTIVNGPDGIFQIDFSPGDLTDIGKFITGIKLDDGGGGIVTYQGHFKIEIKQKIGP